MKEKNILERNYPIDDLQPIINRFTILFFYLAINVSQAQAQVCAFGEVRMFPLPKKCSSTVLIPSGRGELLRLISWSVDENEIIVTTFDSNFTKADFKIKYLPKKCSDLHIMDFNNDKVYDFLIVNKNDKTLSVMLDVGTDTLKSVSNYVLSFEPENIVISDFNNDKNIDILVYSRKVPGILPLIGNKKGSFVLGKMIAPDNSISALSFVDMNSDRLIDLVLADWVKHEIHILYGVGKGRFIDQSVFQTNGEIEKIIPVSLFKKQTVDFVMFSRDPSEFQIWESSYFGDLQKRSSIPVKVQISDFGIEDINSDGNKDIISIIERSSLGIFFNDGNAIFDEKLTLSCGVNPQKLFMFRNANSFIDCLVFDKDKNQFILFKNAMSKGSLPDSIQLSTSQYPTEIAVGDFNNDGIGDFSVLNTKSASISVYWGKNMTIPYGPFIHTLTKEPDHFVFHSTSDSLFRFVLSYNQSEQLSFLIIDTANNFVSNSFIGCEGKVQILSISNNKEKNVEIATFNSESAEGNSISLYEQINVTTFIERTFRLSPPNQILGAEVIDLNADNYRDILFTYRMGDTSLIELGVVYGDSNYTMKRKIISLEFSMPDVKRNYLYKADFDKDNEPDLLLYVDKPINDIMVIKGKGEGQFDDPKVLIEGLQIEERSNIQIVDVDGDNQIDIVIGTPKLNKISWLRNLGDFTFDVENILYTQQGFSHYAVSDIDGDGMKDLILTLPKDGVVKIINGKLLNKYLNLVK